MTRLQLVNLRIAMVIQAKPCFTGRQLEGVVSHNDLENWGPELAAHLRLRARIFGEKYRKVITLYRGMETDRYDTPFASYLTRLGPPEVAIGAVRLSPTDLPYMLRDNWPGMWEAGELPDSARVMEATRFCVDDWLHGPMRRQVKNELVCALLDFALSRGVEAIIAVSPPRWWKSIFVDAGWPVERVGKEKWLDEICVAGLLRVTEATLYSVREVTGIDYPVLANQPPRHVLFPCKSGM